MNKTFSNKKADGLMAQSKGGNTIMSNVHKHAAIMFYLAGLLILLGQNTNCFRQLIPFGVVYQVKKVVLDSDKNRSMWT